MILSQAKVTAGAHHVPSPPGQMPMPSGRNAISTSHTFSLTTVTNKDCLFHCCSIFPPLHFSLPTHHLFITDDIVAGQVYGESIFSLCKNSKAFAENPLTESSYILAYVCKKSLPLCLLLFPFAFLPNNTVYRDVTQIFRTQISQIQSMPVHFLYGK